MNIAVPIVAGLVGIIVGSVLNRRNARRDHGDRLLTDALNDLVSAIASVARQDEDAQHLYASATSRMALHGSPELVHDFAAFQRDAETITEDGRARLIDAIQTARRQLGSKPIDPEAAALLLFGPERAPGRPQRT